MRTYVRMIACVLIPRFGLRRRGGRAARAAHAPGCAGARARRPAGGRRGLGRGRGVRDHGGDAARRGARPLPRPGPDPARPGARRAGLGASGSARSRRSAPRSSRAAGEAFFGLDGLRGLWGRPERALERARRVAGRSRRAGWAPGPTRLCALAAALRSRPRKAPVVVVGARRASGRSSSRCRSGSCATGWRRRVDGRQPGGHARAARGRHPGRAGGAARLGGGRPLRHRRHAGARDGARGRGAAAAAPACARSFARSSTCPTPPPAASSNGRSSSWSTGCWRAPSAAAGASAACGSRRGSRAEAAGGSRR